MNARAAQVSHVAHVTHALDRALGTMYGQACGDALGTTLEFNTAEACWLKFPNGHRTIVGGGAFRVIAGQVTDDTELALTLATHLAECRGGQREPDTEVLFARYCAWARSSPIDIGNATSSALLRLSPDASTEANGALMRISPLGVYFWDRPWALSRVAELAMRDAALTHPNLVCQHASAIYAATIARCVGFPGREADDHFEAAVALAKHLGAKEALADLEMARRAVVSPDHGGHVRIAFRLAFRHLLHTDSVEEAVVATVMGGGDADTNGAIVGALMGAQHGVRRIPVQWVKAVRDARVNRPRQYQAIDLEGLTARLMGAG